jgi:16S rRNA (cytosine967-C5)-methyltransferase
LTRPKPIPPARAAALDCLRRVLHEGRDLQAALDQTLSARPLSAADRSLTTTLVYGVVRLKRRLDVLLDDRLKSPDKLPPRVRLVLEVAAYELLYLDRVPAYATLTWAVDAVKKKYGPGLGRLVNAVLRGLERLGADHADPEQYRKGRATHDPSFLGEFYSCPDWIVRLWVDQYGIDKCVNFLHASITEPPVGIRINLQRDATESMIDRLEADPALIRAEWPAAAFSAFPKAIGRDAIENGLVSLQSMASQQAVFACLPDELATPVWDCCCGRGGKSMAMFERGVEPVLSSDTSLPRLRGFVEDARRLDHRLHPVCADAAAPAPWKTAPPLVVIDAPCSGLGVLSRRPDIRWKRRPEELAQFERMQHAILRARLGELPGGGQALYITCTVNRDENERMAERCAQEAGLSIVNTFATDPSGKLGEFFYAALIG